MKDHDIGVLFKMFDNKESKTTNITSLAAYQTLLDIEKNNNEKLRAQVESLQHYKQSYEELKAEHLETIKAIKQHESEVIKEFAEKIDKILCLQIGPSKRVFWKITDDINNVIKEMVGEDTNVPAK